MLRNRSLIGGAMVAISALVLSGCGSSSTPDAGGASASPGGPTGTPIKFMAIFGETGPVIFPEIGISERAAAKAINEAGGIAGHPVKILTCDAHDPNSAANCARKAVSEKVTAVVGNVGAFGESIMPILAKAGIPEVACQPASSSEITSELSFPISSLALSFAAGAAVLKAAGASSVQYLGPDNPAYVGLNKLVQGLLPAVGIEYKGGSVYPATATDYTQHVAALFGSGASGVYPILTTAGTLPAFINAVNTGGYSVSKTPTVFNGNVFSSSTLAGPLKNKLDGVYVVNSGQTPTDVSLPGIKTYHDEIAANGEKTAYTDAGLGAWVGIHVIADLLAKASGDVTSPAVLVAAMKAAGPIDYPGWVPFDWSKPALPAPLSGIFPRYFSSSFWVSKIVNNEMISAVSGPVPFTGPITLTVK